MGKKKKRNQRLTDVKTSNAKQLEPERNSSEKDKKEKFTSSDLLEKVEEYMENFNFELAETFCERALEISPDDQQVLNVAASLFLEVGKSERAANCLKHAIELEPERGSTKYMMLGQLLEGEEAADCYKKGIELMMLEKQTDKKEEKSAQSGSSFAECEEITDRDISNAFCSLAEIYLTDCCFSENAENSCKEYCSKAVEQDPGNPEAYQVLANFLLSEEKNEEAKEVLSRSLSLWLTGEDSLAAKSQPPSYESRISLSKMLVEVEDFDNACNVLERLLLEDDEVVQVWYLLGWTYHLSGQETSAVTYYLSKAKKLFRQTDCDDEPLLDHIEELLSNIDQNAVSDDGANDDDENSSVSANEDEDENGFKDDDDDDGESMDTNA